MIINFFMLLLHSHSPVLQAVREIMLLRNFLIFHIGIIKWILGSMSVVQHFFRKYFAALHLTMFVIFYFASNRNHSAAIITSSNTVSRERSQ